MLESCWLSCRAGCRGQVVTGTMMKAIASNQAAHMSAPLQAETELIVAAQHGDVRSFNELVRRYQTLVYHTAFRVLGNSQWAEDATQDALISAYRHLGSFRGGLFRAWLMRIVTNACYDQFRTSRRQRSTPLEEMPAQGQSLYALSESPQDFAERSELSDLIQRGLAAMPADQRVTLVLADIDEFSYEEIAAITHANLGTVRSRLARARAHLREYLLAQGNMVPHTYQYFRQHGDCTARRPRTSFASTHLAGP